MQSAATSDQCLPSVPSLHRDGVVGWNQADIQDQCQQAMGGRQGCDLVDALELAGASDAHNGSECGLSGGTAHDGRLYGFIACEG